MPGKDKSGSVSNANYSYAVGLYIVFLGVHRIAKYFTSTPDSLFSKNMRKCIGKHLSIILDTIFLRMLSERVISPQEPIQFSRTKWWPIDLVV